jgi:hypothetical protein
MTSDTASADTALAALVERCIASLPGVSVRQTRGTTTIVVEGEILYLSPGDQIESPNPTRVVLWTEVSCASHLSSDAQLTIANRYVADRLMASGFAMGFNSKQRLLVLGRNIEAATLSEDTLPGLLSQILAELSIAEATAERVAAELEESH